MSTAIDKHLIGLTGEYLVAGMMSLKGWVASLTLKNYPSVDIFGLNPKTNETINIQVKTTKNHSSYQVGIRHDQRNQIRQIIRCPYVFVHIDKNDNIRYFILSKEELINMIELTDNDYFNQPRIKSIQPNYPIAISIKHLASFENKWDSIWVK